MKPIEPTDSGETYFPAGNDNVPSAKNGNYAPVTLNAMKHGILSKLVVLAHENHAEFDDLLAALIDEHRPAGMTERHLIEELASIIWRKRRVLLAEGASINRGLRSVANSTSAASPVQAAAPFERNISIDRPELVEMMSWTPAEMAARQRDADADVAAAQKAASVLRKGGPSAYIQALKTLTPEPRGWWDEHVADGEYPETAEGLDKFIRESVDPLYGQIAKEAHLAPAIKAQMLGEGLRAQTLENLTRYETHLDRKFERTLAMLLKLRMLRDE